MSYEVIKNQDAAVYEAMMRELGRQRDHIELIASENFVSEAVMSAQRLSSEIVQQANDKAAEIEAMAVEKAAAIISQAENKAAEIAETAQQDSQRTRDSAEEEMARARAIHEELTGCKRRRQEYAVGKVEACFSMLRQQYQETIDSLNSKWQDFLCGLYDDESMPDGTLFENGEDAEAPQALPEAAEQGPEGARGGVVQDDQVRDLQPVGDGEPCDEHQHGKDDVHGRQGVIEGCEHHLVRHDHFRDHHGIRILHGQRQRQLQGGTGQGCYKEDAHGHEHQHGADREQPQDLQQLEPEPGEEPGEPHLQALGGGELAPSDPEHGVPYAQLQGHHGEDIEDGQDPLEGLDHGPLTDGAEAAGIRHHAVQQEASAGEAVRQDQDDFDDLDFE